MRTGSAIPVTPSNRLQLGALMRDRNAPEEQVWRAEIVLLSADGLRLGRGVRSNHRRRLLHRTGSCSVCRTSREADQVITSYSFASFPGALRFGSHHIGRLLNTPPASSESNLKDVK